MKCSICGGYVEWKGPLSNLTHTECASCGGKNCQEVEPKPECDEDELLVEQCIEVVRSHNTATVSILQRRLRLGYARAARLMDELERRGVVSAPLDWKSATRTVLPSNEKS